jgi:adenine-specific DNA-methyltransferase
MGRRYIGVEQMDYIETITVERLKKVIAGEQSGISKAVNWKSGGNFIYCELSQANQTFINLIQDAKNSVDLQTIWKTMQERAFLSYKVDPKAFEANKSEFKALSFEEQQRFLIEVLDKNMLYVPYSEIDDATNIIDDRCRALNHQFFSLK